MFTISCYDLHPLAARYKRIWHFSQQASDCVMFLVAMSCCKCWAYNIRDSDSSDDDNSLGSYKIIAKPNPSISLSKIQEEVKEHQVEVEIHHQGGAGDTGGSNPIDEVPLDSDVEVNSDVNASDQKLVFESSESSTESEVGGVKNDCYQVSSCEDMEIIEMEDRSENNSTFHLASNSYKITSDTAYYAEDTVSIPNSSVVRSSRVEIRQSVCIEARSGLQSVSHFPLVHSPRKTDKSIKRLNVGE